MTASSPRIRRVEGIVPEAAVLGLTLLSVGATILASFVVEGLDRYLLLAISAICLAAFGVSREYAFAIPAGITGGIGSMVLINTLVTMTPPTSGSVFFLALAGGFAVIWLLGLLATPRATAPWPLAPAAVLGTLGALIAAGQPLAFDWVQSGVATLFVLAGGALLLRQRGR